MAKSSFRGSSQGFFKFPFVNLQIKSIVESLRPIMSCTQSMKKMSDLLKNMHFRVKNRFSEILKLLRICWTDLIDSIGFLRLLIWTKCLSCLEIISNGP